VSRDQLTGDGSAESVAGALGQRLQTRSNARPAATFPAEFGGVDQAGLYSWWADETGLDDLSAAFDIRLPTLIYAGQTGATSTRSGTERVATLRSRIGGNHLRGNVSSSTFRKTLSAILFDRLDLSLAGPAGQLTGRPTG